MPDSFLLRSDNYLYEAGLKVNLLDNRLFGGMADLRPEAPRAGQSRPARPRPTSKASRSRPTTSRTATSIATASYSYIKTTLSQAPEFYDYPAQPGINIDGAGVFAVFVPGQKFKDPGVPQHLFNFLGNYKFANGIGVRSGVQVTGPMATSGSGELNLVNSSLGGQIALPTGPGGSIKVNASNPA